MRMDDDPFGNAPLSKGLNKKRLASPKPGSPAQLSIQKPTVKKAPDAIHEDLLSLSMDTSPASHSNGVEQEASAPVEKKQKNLQSEPSSKSPQMSTRSSKYKQTGAAIEALDSHPILEPQRGTAENRLPTTSENIQTSKPKDKPVEPFDFVSDLLKTSNPPKDATGKSAKMKFSKSDTSLSNGQTKASVTTRSGKREPIHETSTTAENAAKVCDDIDMESTSSQENQEKLTLSSSPVF